MSELYQTVVMGKSTLYVRLVSLLFTPENKSYFFLFFNFFYFLHFLRIHSKSDIDKINSIKNIYLWKEVNALEKSTLGSRGSEDFIKGEGFAFFFPTL